MGSPSVTGANCQTVRPKGVGEAPGSITNGPPRKDTERRQIVHRRLKREEASPSLDGRVLEIDRAELMTEMANERERWVQS